MNDRARRRLGWTLSALWCANFLACCVIGGFLGGFAYQGKIERSHYFLGDSARSHPTYFNEVTPEIYMYSLWHGRVIAAHTVLTLILLIRFQRRASAQGGKA
jgi:hypothetical protein